jgi:histidine ammonia-lyase
LEYGFVDRIGTLRDLMAYARRQFEIELNAVADNPVFLWEDKLVLTGANFQGSPVSLPSTWWGPGSRWSRCCPNGG